VTAVPSATPPAFTLDQKIGQLLLVGMNGTRLTRETWYQITNLAVGGVALRSRNVTDAAQVAQLAFDLQSAAAERGLPPLFIAVDQEGGDVARLRDGVTRFPSPMALGAAADAQLAERAGYATAAELLARGINVNLAPVLDLLTDPNNTAIGTRSFGTDPAGVTESGVAFLRGEMQTRVIPVIKHYPGLGGASIDTHAGLAAVTAPDTTAFDAAIAAGAPVVMVGHIWDKSLDPQPVPASLSPNVIARLRQTFAGVILTDSLNMGAVTSFYSVPAAAVQALRAGADWLIVAEPADVPGVIAAIRAAVRRGDLPEARLDEALARVWALKSRLRPETAADMVAAHEADGPDTARKIARRSIAQAGPQPGLLPLSPAVGRILLLAPNSLGPAAAGDAHITLLAQLIGQRGPRVTELLYDLDDPARNTDYALQAALYANITDVVLFGAWDAGARRDTLQRDALTQALRSGKPVIVLGLHTPFDVNYLTSAPVYLAAFGPAQPQMEALVEALFGEIEITGMMPTINP
jgi:beta-N-acetylhexosaminidase